MLQASFLAVGKNCYVVCGKWSTL